MKLPARHATLIAGLAIILLANAAALLGVAYNRSGTPESQLTLTQRELAPSNRWQQRDESSLWLTLQWRVPLTISNDRIPTWPSYHAGSPEWLDEAKLRALGFRLPAGEPHQRFYHYERKKRVLLVLELDGPAYQEALRRAEAAVAERRALAAALPGKPELERALDDAVQALQRERNEHSRLFAVDAGLSADALRSRYPDRTRHAIVPGWVYPFYDAGREASGGRWAGHVERVERQRIHVPRQWHAALTRTAAAAGGEAAFSAMLAFGRRLEPWLVTVSPAP